MLQIAVEDAGQPSSTAISAGLRAHNIAKGGTAGQFEEFVVTLRDDAGNLVGGLNCHILLRGLLIEAASITEKYRGSGHGRALIAAAEAHGVRRGAVMAHLDTFTFQARGFYERCGYEVFGVLPYPNGVERFYVRKSLVDG